MTCSRVFRLLCAAAAALSLAACAQFHPHQPKGTALVRVGDYDSTGDPAVLASRAHGWLGAEEVAGYYAPYALMSLRVYGEAKDAGERWDTLMKAEGLPGRSMETLVGAWLKDWRNMGSVRLPIASEHQIGPLPCSQERLSSGQCSVNLAGLGYEIWVHRHCREVVIAFRGTDFREANDWLTNFHWFTRLLPINDQYEQVQDHISDIAKRMRKLCQGKHPVLTAVGHSLGGGLAQQAAYVEPGIKRVYAFDPSVVTGYHDIHSKRGNLQDLKIDRVYEHGEFLAYFRYVQRQFAPPSACNPQIRTVRLNSDSGSVVDQHSMATITANLLRSAGTPEQWRARRKFTLPDGERGDQVNCARVG